MKAGNFVAVLGVLSNDGPPNGNAAVNVDYIHRHELVSGAKNTCEHILSLLMLGIPTALVGMKKQPKNVVKWLLVITVTAIIGPMWASGLFGPQVILNHLFPFNSSLFIFSRVDSSRRIMPSVVMHYRMLRIGTRRRWAASSPSSAGSSWRGRCS